MLGTANQMAAEEKVARMEGLEPSTNCLEDSYSDPLSYIRAEKFGECGRIRTTDLQLMKLPL